MTAGPPTQILLTMNKPNEWIDHCILNDNFLIRENNVAISPKPDILVRCMRDPPLRRRGAVRTFKTVLHAVPMNEFINLCTHRGATRNGVCEGVDEPALHCVDLHVGVDAAEGVGGPVFAVARERAVGIVRFHESVDNGPWVVC